MVKETFNAKETFEAGYEMGKKALPGQIYCLNGDLGVGKTVFTQGFAKGLNRRACQQPYIYNYSGIP